jgi:hypothetical protein
MKITHGASLLANVKTALAFFSDSPNHLFSTEDASTLKNEAPPSVATARQINSDNQVEEYTPQLHYKIC